VTVESWLDEHGRHLPSAPQVAGAIAQSDGRTFLLPEAVWRTLTAINEFRSQSPETRTPDGNRRAWATIRRHAVEAKSQLGDFLQHTIVVKPERLRIGLRKVEFGDDKVIEVAPSFDGAPGKWMEFFDRFPVGNRYDVPTGEGIVQVVIEPSVRQVLEEIKRIPGRRVAGARAEAFIANPFAALGGNANSVTKDFFEQGNAHMLQRYKHGFPWTK